MLTMQLHVLVCVVVALRLDVVGAQAAASRPRWLLTDALNAAAQRFGGLSSLGLHRNATEASVTFWRTADATLWILPQYVAVNDSFYTNVTENLNSTPDSVCSYATGAASFVRISGATACAADMLSAAASNACVQLIMESISSSGTPPPAGVVFSASATTYIPDLDVLFSFGAFAAASDEQYYADVAFFPQQAVDLCRAKQQANDSSSATFLAFHPSTYIFNVSSRVWSAWSYADTGPDTPASNGTSPVCMSAAGLTATYSRALNAVVAIGAYNDCHSPNYVPVHVFNRTTHVWRRLASSWSIPAVDRPGCDVPVYVTRGVYSWLDPVEQTTLVMWGGNTYGRLFASYTCFALNVVTLNGTQLPSCSYSETTAPPSMLDMSSDASSTSTTILVVGGRTPVNGPTPETSTAVTFNQIMWTLDGSAAAAPLWTRQAVQIESGEIWAALSAASGTLARAKLWRVNTDADGDTYIAWGGLMANASLPQLQYQWSLGGQCSRFEGGDWILSGTAVAAPQALHVLWVPSTARVSLQSTRAITLAAVIIAVLFGGAASLAAIALTCKCGTIRYNCDKGSSYVLAFLPTFAVASALSNATIAALLSVLVGAYSGNASSTSFLMFVWLVVQLTGNVAISVLTVRAAAADGGLRLVTAGMLVLALPFAYAASVASSSGKLRLAASHARVGPAMDEDAAAVRSRIEERARRLATMSFAAEAAADAFNDADASPRGVAAEEAVLRTAAVATAHNSERVDAAMELVDTVILCAALVLSVVIVTAESDTLLCFNRTCFPLYPLFAVELVFVLIGVLTHAHAITMRLVRTRRARMALRRLRHVRLGEPLIPGQLQQSEVDTSQVALMQALSSARDTGAARPGLRASVAVIPLLRYPAAPLDTVNRAFFEEGTEGTNIEER